MDVQIKDYMVQGSRTGIGKGKEKEGLIMLILN